MPIIKSAKKAARQTIKHRNSNQEIKKTVRNALREFRENPNMETYSHIQSEYDKTVKKGLMKKNTVSRRKAKLAAFAKEHGVKIEATAKPATKKAAPAKKTTAKKATAKKADK